MRTKLNPQPEPPIFRYIYDFLIAILDFFRRLLGLM